MIDSIITNYLNANKRLVIPGFGAFIRKDLGNVVLVEFLKKDDGVLTSLVGEKYSVSEEQARGIVDQFIERVKAEVDGTGKSVVDGLGVVYKETSGVYEIEYRPGIVRAKQAKVADVPRPAIVPASPAIQASAKPGESAVHHQHRSQSNPAHHQSDTVDIAAGKSERRAVTTPAMTDAGTKTGAITGAISGATTPQHDAAQAKPHRHSAVQSTQATQTQYTTHSAHAPKTTNMSKAAHAEKAVPAPPHSAPRRRPAPPRNNKGGRRNSNRADLIMIIAIISALVAIASIIFGIMIGNDPVSNMQSTSAESISTESISTQSISPAQQEQQTEAETTPE